MKLEVGVTTQNCLITIFIPLVQWKHTSWALCACLSAGMCFSLTCKICPYVLSWFDLNASYLVCQLCGLPFSTWGGMSAYLVAQSSLHTPWLQGWFLPFIASYLESCTMRPTQEQKGLDWTALYYLSYSIPSKFISCSSKVMCILGIPFPSQSCAIRSRLPSRNCRGRKRRQVMG